MHFEKKHIYWGILATVAIVGIWAYKTRLPNIKDVKVSADGTSEDDCEKKDRNTDEKFSSSEFRGRGWRGRGWGGYGWGYPYGYGYGYPVYGYEQTCQITKDGVTIKAPCSQLL